MWTGFIWRRTQEQRSGSPEHDNEPSGCIECWEILEYVSAYLFPQEGLCSTECWGEWRRWRKVICNHQHGSQDSEVVGRAGAEDVFTETAHVWCIKLTNANGNCVFAAKAKLYRLHRLTGYEYTNYSERIYTMNGLKFVSVTPFEVAPPPPPPNIPTQEFHMLLIYVRFLL